MENIYNHLFSTQQSVGHELASAYRRCAFRLQKNKCFLNVIFGRRDIEYKNIGF